MRRIVPATLLAAFVVLPTKTMPTPSLILSSVAVGIDDDAPGLKTPVRLNDSDAREIGPIGKPGSWPSPIAASLALDAILGLHDRPRRGFELYPDDQGRADPARSDASPHAGAALSGGDGATPPVSVASAQSSATVTGERGDNAASSMTPPAVAFERENDSELRQTYVGLIKPENMAREQRCLAEVIYFEARSEAEDGRAAIAQVVLNRVKSGVYPDSVCGVVYQNRHRKLACQFTFACEGKSLRVTEPEPWEAAVRIARDVYAGKIYLAEVGASTHYHADYVRPHWAKKLKKMDVIGRHIFYS